MTINFTTDVEWRVAASLLFEPPVEWRTTYVADIRSEVLDRQDRGPSIYTDDDLTERVAALIERGGFIIPGHPCWPAGLDQLANPPVMLWYRGDPSILDHWTSVAMVGARASTEYGNRVAVDIAQGLGDRDWTVVSGAAYGIDIAAHRGALLSKKHRTVAVLACGADRAYPAAHRDVLDRIVQSGGLIVSEVTPGTAPARSRFLARNRIIAALSAGTVVVEASERSGSMNTARHTREIGRPLMAVPGPVTSITSLGTNGLIREGNATLVTSATDIATTVHEFRRL